MFDLGSYVINGVSLALVVFGLVAFAKSLGLSGKGLTIASMALGITLGVLYQISLQVPAGFAGWFGAAMFGLATGIVASGTYDQIERWIAKAKPGD